MFIKINGDNRGEGDIKKEAIEIAKKNRDCVTFEVVKGGEYFDTGYVCFYDGKNESNKKDIVEFDCWESQIQ